MQNTHKCTHALCVCVFVCLFVCLFLIVNLVMPKGITTPKTSVWYVCYMKTLHYKPEGHGFDYRWCHWSFSLTYGHNMVLGLTQPLTEMSTRNIS